MCTWGMRKVLDIISLESLDSPESLKYKSDSLNKQTLPYNGSWLCIKHSQYLLDAKEWI